MGISTNKGRADSEHDFVRELQRVGRGLERRVHDGDGMVGGPAADAGWVRSGFELEVIRP